VCVCERERLKQKLHDCCCPLLFGSMISRWFPPLDDVFPIWFGLAPHLVSSTSNPTLGGGGIWMKFIVWLLWCKSSHSKLCHHYIYVCVCWQTNPSFLPFFLASFHPIGEDKLDEIEGCFFHLVRKNWMKSKVVFPNWWRKIGWNLRLFFPIGEEE
jgi:hypothetical protein